MRESGYPILPVAPFGSDGRIMIPYYCVVAERRNNARTVSREPTVSQDQTAPIEAGAVHVPTHAPWLDEFKKEALSFPFSKHDDQIDELSQARFESFRANTA